MLVEYENSDSEPDEKNDEEIATKETAETAQISDDDDRADPGEVAEHQTAGGGGDGLATFAAADDTVEEGLLNRVPASAPPLQPKPTATAVQVQKQQQLLLQQKRRRLLMLEPSRARSGDGNDDDEDDDDEDAAKRRRIASATATCLMRGATSLLARLPKPKALAVREGGSRLFLPSAPQPQPPRPMPLPAAEESPATSSSSVLFAEPDFHQQHLLGAVLPPSELHRYRQATGASLTADSDGGGIIDILQADQVAGSDIELTKELTRNAGADPRRRPEGPEPSSMDKRKHQITYLAYQAKERELELKNSWSDARFSQRSSQKKYGF